MENFLDLSTLLRKSREEIQHLHQENQVQKEEIERLVSAKEGLRIDLYKANNRWSEEMDQNKSLEKVLARERALFEEREALLNCANEKVNRLQTELARANQCKDEYRSKYSTSQQSMDDFKSNGVRLIRQLEEKSVEIVGLNKKVHEFHLKWSLKREEYDHLLFVHQQRERQIQLLVPDLEDKKMSVDQLLEDGACKALQFQEKLANTQEQLSEALEKLEKAERTISKLKTTNDKVEIERLEKDLAAANLNEHLKGIKLEKCLECLVAFAKCGVCDCTYTTTGDTVPKILAACGHTYCIGCLEKINKNTGDRNGYIKCPTCRKQSSVKTMCPKNMLVIQALVPEVYQALEQNQV